MLDATSVCTPSLRTSKRHCDGAERLRRRYAFYQRLGNRQQLFFQGPYTGEVHGRFLEISSILCARQKWRDTDLRNIARIGPMSIFIIRHGNLRSRPTHVRATNRQRCYNPGMNQQHFDVVVIGTGPGGEGAAMQAAKHGKRVAVVERFDKIGGGCTHWATIPSKALRYAIFQMTEANHNPLFREAGRLAALLVSRAATLGASR